MTLTAAVISSTVSPRTRSAIRKAPIWEGVTSPAIIAPKAASAWAGDSGLPWATTPIRVLKSTVGAVDRTVAFISGDLFRAQIGAAILQEVAEDLVPVL